LLSEYFELLISAYREDRDGKTLVEWFRDDWGLFEHPRMDSTRANELLAQILNDEDISRRRYLPVYRSEVNSLQQWENLRHELMYRNRFFPAVEIDRGRLEALLFSLAMDRGEVPGLWYRGRIQISDEPFIADQMGAPPPRTASHGRANPAGIPYLYLGSTQQTAICEIRPHTGELVCVAEFRVAENLTLVDLRMPRKTVSPFLLEGGEEIGRMRNDLPFLARLGDELTRPVIPQTAAIDYTPTQYLCEFIKKCNYDGLVYRSSVGEGINLALFNPEAAGCGTITQHRVNRVSVESEPI
jgi:hypothetical protein